MTLADRKRRNHRNPIFFFVLVATLLNILYIGCCLSSSVGIFYTKNRLFVCLFVERVKLSRLKKKKN